MADLFNLLDGIFTKEDLGMIRESEINMFVILRTLSSNPRLVSLASELTLLQGRVPNSMLYKVLQSVTPKLDKCPNVTVPFNNSKKDREVLDRLCEIFYCSYSQAKEYKQLLELQNINLEETLGVNPSDISKLKKKKRNRRK